MEPHRFACVAHCIENQGPRTKKVLLRPGDITRYFEKHRIDWTNQSPVPVASIKVMKSIITFYTKARAHTQLADFYDACAQVRFLPCMLRAP